MADASKLNRLRRSGLGTPPSIEEARSDLGPLPETAGDAGRQNAAKLERRGGEEAADWAGSRVATPTARRIDGRTLRRSGRTVQFATRVSPEFDERIRQIARRKGMLLVEVLEQALEAYDSSR